MADHEAIYKQFLSAHKGQLQDRCFKKQIKPPNKWKPQNPTKQKAPTKIQNLPFLKFLQAGQIIATEVFTLCLDP